jgi:hypothetical protein
MRVTRTEIIGGYETANKVSKSTLLIRADGTYEQTVRLTTGGQLDAHGKWSYDEEESRLTLPKAYFIDFDTVESFQTTQSIPVLKFGGIVQLEVNPGASITYEKVGRE